MKEKAKVRNGKNESRSGTACGMRGRRKKKKWSEFERNMRTWRPEVKVLGRSGKNESRSEITVAWSAD